MTVPTQRGPEMGGQDVLHYLAGTVDQLVGSVERGFRETRAAVDALRQESVTRREFDQRIGDVVADVAEIKQQREREAREAAEAARAAAHVRRTERWQRFALAVGTVTGLTGTVVALLMHFH